jgi:hypothetical protein
MARIEVKQYRVYRERGFWCPNAQQRASGFRSTPCGLDGPAAWAMAEEINERWRAVKRGDLPAPALAGTDRKLTPEQADHLIPYRKGSLGAGFQAYRKTSVWSQDKKPRTREDWMRAWKHIGPVFGHKNPRTVTLSMIAAFRDAVRDRYGVREAHRVIKIWRALWRVNALNKLCDLDADPSKGFENHAADGRNVFWLEAEAVALGNRAWDLGYHGLAALIGVMWDTQMSPVDVRTLRALQMQTAIAGGGAMFFTKRTKTDVPVGGLLRESSTLRLAAYLEKLGVTLAPEAFVFRNRSGVPYSKDTLGDDFRAVRLDLYGPFESRTLGDFRRSGSIEAVAGQASPAALAHVMGNSLDRCHELFRTYCPVNVVSLQDVAEARERGAKRLAEARTGTEMRNGPAEKCATPSEGVAKCLK